MSKQKKMKAKYLKALKNNQNPNKVEIETDEPKSLKLKCDNCEHQFELYLGAIKTEFLGGDVEWRFFECPECSLRYTTYIGDKRVEKGIARRNLYRKAIQDELAKGENLNQKVYWENQQADSEEAKKIDRRTRQLKKEWKIDEREKEFVL